MSTYLLLDVNYLAHRAFHTTGSLEYNEVKTGVIYGILQTILTLQSQFDTNRLVFCFDRGPLLREEVYPKYKGNRTLDEAAPDYDEQVKARSTMRKQVKLLRTKFLEQVGFKNVFHAKGFEADDIIASICQTLDSSQDAIIVSADKDLWQLLRHNIRFYNPSSGKLLTQDRFEAEWGISPKKWHRVKAMVGCDTDNVDGIKGVGDKTAIKYLLGKLKPDSAAALAIEKHKDLIKFNRKLVKLPYEGTPEFTLKDDKVEPSRWAELTKALGMKSLTNSMGTKPKGVKNGREGQRGFF